MSQISQETINEHVAHQLTKRRAEVGLTQQQVAQTVGISFQQYQKYEHGKNRVSVGRLYMLAETLDTKIEYFFEGYDRAASGKTPVSESNIDTLGSARLVRQFNAISSPALKQTILGMIRALEPGK